MLQTVLSDEVLTYIKNRDWQSLARSRYKWPDPDIVAPDIVDEIVQLDKKDKVLLFRALPRDLAVEVFSYLEGETADDLLVSLTDAETRNILCEMSVDDRTALLEELPGELTQRLLGMLSPEDLAEARQFLGYPEESVGRLMIPDYVKVNTDWTLGQAIDHIREVGRESESLSVIYVVDSRGVLVDGLPLQRFILSPPETRVHEIMDGSFVSLDATADREEAVRLARRYHRLMLPVVDTRGLLIGVVTVDDIIDVSEEETTEDFHLQAAVTPLRTSYRDAGVFDLFRSRIGWLCVLVVVNLISSGVIAAYETTLDTVVALAFFIPLIIGTGGNAGSQSATLMIRAISTGDIRMNQWFRVFAKELVIGLLIGLALGVLGFGLGHWRGGPEVGLVVFLTLIAILVITNLIGMSLPFVLNVVKADPAVASGPLITSVADAVGLLIYFGFATWLLL
ncbi:MAG: magnesium transporter [Spirochaetaceae bacterium]